MERLIKLWQAIADSYRLAKNYPVATAYENCIKDISVYITQQPLSGSPEGSPKSCPNCGLARDYNKIHDVCPMCGTTSDNGERCTTLR